MTAVCAIHTTVGWNGVRVDGKKIDCISESSDAFKNTRHHLVLSNTVATVDLGPNWSLQVTLNIKQEENFVDLAGCLQIFKKIDCVNYVLFLGSVDIEQTIVFDWRSMKSQLTAIFLSEKNLSLEVLESKLEIWKYSEVDSRNIRLIEY